MPNPQPHTKGQMSPSNIDFIKRIRNVSGIIMGITVPLALFLGGLSTTTPIFGIALIVAVFSSATFGLMIGILSFPG